MFNFNKIHRLTINSQGFTLVELMLTIAIIGILSSIAIPSYQDYTERAKVSQAIIDINAMSATIEHYFSEERTYPDSLADVNLASKLDPWGHPYQYLNLNKNGNGGARRDKNLNPLNSDFDLYSIGKDNETRLPITQKFSLDDVLRANDGNFINLAEKY